MKKIKICFISPKSYPLFNPKCKATFGGAEVQLSLLAKEFSNYENLEVSVMVADYGQREVEFFKKVRIERSLDFSKNKLLQIIKFFKIFNKINADIYIQRTLTPFSGIIALYCKLTRKKFVYMIANDGEANGSHKVFQSFISKYLANLTFKYANKIIVQNNYQKRFLKKLKNINSNLINSVWPPEKIHNWIKRKYILWVGRVDRDYKQPEIFLELTQSFPKEKFIMIAPPTKDQEDYFDQIKLKARDIKNLKFIGFVKFNKMGVYFRRAKILINTSISEGFPNTFLQANAFGVPIISLNVNPNNFLEKGNCGIFARGNLKIMKRQLTSLINNPQKVRKLQNSARNHLTKKNNLKKNAAKILEVINHA